MQDRQIKLIDSYDQKTIVHDISYDYTGKRLATGCSDKKIRIYIKINNQWIFQSKISIPGSPIWKVKWARPQLGIIIAACSLDGHIRIYQWKRMQKNNDEKYDWYPLHDHPQNMKTIEDIKFAPFKDQGLALAIATTDGQLKVLQPHDLMRPKEWQLPPYIQICDLGINCISWSKNMLRQDSIIAIGCKNKQTSPKRVIDGMKIQTKGNPIKLQQPSTTIVFVSFDSKRQVKFKLLQHYIKQHKAVNDISWALMNGRSYYLLAVSLDNGFKIFELNIRQNSTTIQVLKQIKLSQTPTLKISWNILGTHISLSQKNKVRTWKAIGRSIWTQIIQLQQA